MNRNLRQNETIGSIDARVLALEMSSLYRWEKWFGKNPGVVLGVVVVTICSAAWMIHTWQIDRIDRSHQEELNRKIGRASCRERV